ncbi:MAG: hypothetical protein JNN08_25260 [Bryobacterales bacterium]|nr:hypothetical protein [Bryobacterales bacterium]
MPPLCRIDASKVEEGADRLAAELKGELALTQVKLASWTQTPPKDADIPARQLLLLDSGPPRVIPSSRLLDAPFRQGLPDDGLAFQKAEAFEFQENRLRAAAEAYRLLADSPHPAARRAGALRFEAGRPEAAPTGVQPDH